MNVLKEAMAMGLPVISTLHGGIPELVQDGISGFLVPERDADALAERLDYLISHPERWAEMGQAGRAFVATAFDLDQLNHRLFELYARLTSPGPLAVETGQSLTHPSAPAASRSALSPPTKVALPPNSANLGGL